MSLADGTQARLRPAWHRFLRRHAAAICLLLAAACGTAPRAPDQIRLALGYVPNVQFAPYYVAMAEGYFSAAGLTVVPEYVSELEILKMVSSGRFEFAATDGDSVILARLQGLPIRYVFTHYSQYPVGLITLRSRGFRSLFDLRGSVVGIPEFFGSSYIGLKALLFAGGLTEADFQLKAIGYTQASTLAEGRADAVMGFLANEPVLLEESGFPVDVLPVSSVANLVGPGLVTSERMLAEEPERARAFVAALRQGLQRTLQDPDAAFQMALEYIPDLSGEKNLRVQREVLQRAILLWRQDRALGWSEEARWEESQDLLFRSGMIGRRLPATVFFTNELLGVTPPMR